MVGHMLCDTQVWVVHTLHFAGHATQLQSHRCHNCWCIATYREFIQVKNHPVESSASHPVTTLQVVTLIG